MKAKLCHFETSPLVILKIIKLLSFY